MTRKIGSVSHVDTAKIDTIDEVVDRIEVDTTSIESKVDTIDSIADDITVDTSKIDDVAINGLAGVSGSLAYKIAEIERHFHGREKWFGVAASPLGETHKADRVGGATSAFTLTSGNNDFGAWLQILGSSDSPIEVGRVYMDAHRFLVSSTNSTSPYIIQIAAGESADLATFIANEQMSETMYIASTNLFDSGIQEIMTSRVASGTKIWARCACIGQNAKTISLYYGIHEYEG